jgi:hypothetical protein
LRRRNEKKNKKPAGRSSRHRGRRPDSLNRRRSGRLGQPPPSRPGTERKRQATAGNASAGEGTVSEPTRYRRERRSLVLSGRTRTRFEERGYPRRAARREPTPSLLLPRVGLDIPTRPAVAEGRYPANRRCNAVGGRACRPARAGALLRR